ncbi:MAG: MbeD/MobD family mobilization/exclusion protein [Microlunatus sp.]
MTSTTTQAPSPAQTRKAAVESEYAPLYAAAGLTDLAVESIRNLVLATQEKVTKQLSEWQGSFTQLQSKGSEQAKHAGEFVRTLPEQVKALPEQLKTLPETTKARIEELDKQRKELLAEATVAYGDLAGRGKKVIDDSVLAVRTTSTEVKTDVETKVAEAEAKVEEKVAEVREDVAAAIDPELAEAAREAASAKRSAAAKKAAATRKANAAKKAADNADA